MQNTSKSKKKVAIALSWLLVFLWMGFIFFMSAQDSTNSSAYSRPIAESVVKFQVKYHITQDHGYTALQYLNEVESTVRKIAHSTIFFILSVLVSMSLLLSDIKRSRVLFISIALSLLYAFIDEFHQFFVPGRASEMADILLDMLGILLGTVLTLTIASVVIKIRTKRRPVPAAAAEPVPVPAPRPEKVIPFKPRQEAAPQAPVREDIPAAEPSAVRTSGKIKERAISIPVWIKLGFIVSFSVLCALISYSVQYMPIVFILAFFIMLAAVFKTRFLDNNIQKINPVQVLIAILLSAFTVLRVYASFRLVANAFIAEQGTVIEDFYYNFIRSSLSAFAVPAIATLWYILLGKARELAEKIKFTKLEIGYIAALTGIASLVLLYLYHRTHVFYSPAEHTHIIFSLDSYTIINEFAYTNFTSGVNNIFSPVFSLGAMPFGVLSRMLSYPLSILPGYGMQNAEALALSAVNAALLGLSAVLLARAFAVRNRALFIAFITLLFPSLLSILLPTGSIVILFYISVFLFVTAKTKSDYAPLITVISAGFLPFALLPFAMDRHRNKIRNILRSFLLLAACILLLSNFISFADVIQTIKHVPRINEMARAAMNTSFMSIFVPNSLVNPTPYYTLEYLPSTLSLIGGAAIAFAAFMGFLLNRKKQAAKISMLAILIGMLFSLYFVAALTPSGAIAYLACFAWAYAALIYLLAEKVLRGDSKLFKIVIAAALITLAIYNYNLIRDIIVFSFNYYTV